MLIREVLLFTGLEVRTELLLDSAVARGICRREGVGTIRHLSTKVLLLQQLVKRGVVTIGACSSAETRADLGTKPLPAHRLQKLRQWNGQEDEQRKAVERMVFDVGKATEESWTHWKTW